MKKPSKPGPGVNSRQHQSQDKKQRCQTRSVTVRFIEGRTMGFVSTDCYREMKHPRMGTVIPRKGK